MDVVGGLKAGTSVTRALSVARVFSCGHLGWNMEKHFDIDGTFCLPLEVTLIKTYQDKLHKPKTKRFHVESEQFHRLSLRTRLEHAVPVVGDATSASRKGATQYPAGRPGFAVAHPTSERDRS